MVRNRAVLSDSVPVWPGLRHEQGVTGGVAEAGLDQSQEAATVYGRVTDGAVSQAPEGSDR